MLRAAIHGGREHGEGADTPHNSRLESPHKAKVPEGRLRGHVPSVQSRSHGIFRKRENTQIEKSIQCSRIDDSAAVNSHLYGVRNDKRLES